MGQSSSAEVNLHKAKAAAKLARIRARRPKRTRADFQNPARLQLKPRRLKPPTSTSQWLVHAGSLRREARELESQLPSAERAARIADLLERADSAERHVASLREQKSAAKNWRA